MRVRWSELEANADEQGQNLPLSVLVSILNRCDDDYHRRAKPRLSDRAYDTLKDWLRARKPSSSYFKKVGATPTSRKVKLPFSIFSLDKIKGATAVSKYSSEYEGPYVLSDKLDGASLELDWRASPKMYTRGDGKMGQDVSKLIPVIKGIPTKLPKIVVRGEAMMPQSAFDKYFKNKYVNARNLAAGALNSSKKVHEAAPHLIFVAHELLEPRKQPSKALAYLKSLGFNVVPHTVVRNVTIDSLSRVLKSRRSKSAHLIDGIVVEQDKAMPLRDGNPLHKVAFKELQGEDVVHAKVTGITVEVSKGGLLVPTIQIEPVKLQGVTIRNITGHNGWFIEHGYRYKDRNKGMPVRPINKGSIVAVTRSGDVIPHVIEVVKAAKVPAQPKTAFVYGKNKVAWVSKDERDLELSKAKQITHFFRTCGIDFVKLASVQKFMGAGLTSIIKILHAKKSDFETVEGFGPGMAQKVYTSIHSKIDQIPIHILMDASGLFGPGMGSKKHKLVVDKYGPAILGWDSLTRTQIRDKVLEVRGFKDTALQYAVGIPKFLKWLRLSRLRPTWPVKVGLVRGGSTSKLNGAVVVFTGFRSKELELEIQKRGGEIGSGVTKNTTILVVKDKAAGSTKIEKARALGIKIVDEQGLRKLL